MLTVAEHDIHNDYTQGFVRGYPSVKPYNFKDKARSVRDYVAYMLVRTHSMFEYTGLPDTIPKRVLELYLQTNGNVCIAEHEGKLYAFTGGLGGEPNEYYMPTIYTVANPYLRFSKMFKIGEDCVVIPSDSLYLGVLPMFRKYATQLAENDLSMNIVDIMARVVSLFSASDDKTMKSAEKYIKDVVDGNLGIIAESAFLDGIRAQPISSSSYNAITPLIEYQQYIKASWLNDIGLNANFNMKREALNSSESSLNQDSLLPLVDDMLRCRQIGIDAVNKMFGTNISVKLSSSWEDNQQEIEAEHNAIIAEAGGEPDAEPPAGGVDTPPEDGANPEDTPPDTEPEAKEDIVAEVVEVVERVEQELDQLVDTVLEGGETVDEPETD